MTGLCPSFPSPSLASKDFGGETIFPVHSWSNFSPSDGNLCHATPNPTTTTTTTTQKKGAKKENDEVNHQKNPSKIRTLFGIKITKKTLGFLGVCLKSPGKSRAGASSVTQFHGTRRETCGNVRRPVPIEVAARFKAVDSGVPDRCFAGIFCRRGNKTKQDKQTKHTTRKLKHNKNDCEVVFFLQDLNLFRSRQNCFSMIHFFVIYIWYTVQVICCCDFTQYTPPYHFHPK